MHACVMKWRIVVGFLCSDLSSMVGLMTHFLQLATVARGLRGDICMAENDCSVQIFKLAKGVDHHVQLFAAVAAIEKSFW